MIPTVIDLKSSPLVHRFGDLFNPPGLTNFIGTVQMDVDVTGMRCLTFPPFGCANTITAALFVDGRYFPATGTPITFTWYPDRVEREADYRGLHIKTVTTLAVGQTAALLDLQVENRSGERRTCEIRLGLQGGVTKAVRVWNAAIAPTEGDNDVTIDEGRGALYFSARNSSAHLIQGTTLQADELNRKGLGFKFSLEPGETWRTGFVAAVGDDVDQTPELYDRLISDVPGEIDRVRDDWNAELQAVFTPGNSRYSGHMPTLHTTDPEVLKVYQMGILGVIYFKRDNPYSVYGRAYDTLMPRYWHSVTFMWDYSLSTLVHALLDPVVMKKYLEHWMQLDIHQHFGSEYLTGAGVGSWYSVNDHAMSRIASDYLRWSGNLDWLEQTITSAGSGQRVYDYLQRYATNWKQFQQPSGRADYGGLLNLLECVSTYIHEVASLNAANVFNMRFGAELAALAGDLDRQNTLELESQTLIKAIQELYNDGQGSWRAGYPGGELVDVGHCYDFITILNTIPDDLTPRQKTEMVAYFQREYQTPTWMRALAAGDPDVLFSVRPDHQWTGAYPAWPPQAVTGLYRIGEVDLAFQWLKGLAQSANQGPYGQAHFVEDIIAPEDGGARKAPMEMPFITDWACSSNGAWANIIIESIFGVQAGLDGKLSAQPQFGPFDPKAELHNLAYQGKLYHVDRTGIKS